MTWLDRERLTVYPRIFLVLYLLVGIALAISAGRSSTGLTDFLGRPLGADFSHYWIASSLALSGDPLTVYRPAEFLAAQEMFFQVRFPLPWLYPPTFLLIVLPLALLPYLASLAVWLATTLSAYLTVLRRIAPHPHTLWLALAFPGTFQNFFHGQNGFLSAALLGGGLLLLDHAPLRAGFLIGLASYKPHLMLLVPVALAAAGRWQALAATLASAGILALVSFFVFGPEVWADYWKNLSLPMKLLEEGLLPTGKMVTVFAAVLLAGGGLALAMAVQIIVMLGVGCAVFWLWHRQTSPGVRASGLTLGILLFTPYAFTYDLALLGLALAWLGWEGFVSGWQPGEQVLLVFGWLTPILATVWAMAKVQLTPLILVILFLAVLRRSKMGISPIKMN